MRLMLKSGMGRKGLTLIEILAVVILMSIVLTTMMNSIVQAQRIHIRSDAGTHVALIAQQKMAEITALPFYELTVGSTPFAEDYKYPINGTVTITDEDNREIKKIEVICKVQLPHGDKEFRLTTLRTSH